MVRPRKAVKLPMTTISVSEELLRQMIMKKQYPQTWHDFINKMFHEWRGLRTVLEDLELTIKNQEALIDFYKKKELRKMTLSQ